MNTDLFSLFSLCSFRMAYVAKKTVVDLNFSDEEPLEIQSSDMMEDENSDESSDKDLHVI